MQVGRDNFLWCVHLLHFKKVNLKDNVSRQKSCFKIPSRLYGWRLQLKICLDFCPPWIAVKTGQAFINNYTPLQCATLSCTTYWNAPKVIQYLLQDIKTEQSGPGNDAALPGLVSSEDEVGWSEQLGLRQESFGFLVAAVKNIQLGKLSVREGESTG